MNENHFTPSEVAASVPTEGEQAAILANKDRLDEIQARWDAALPHIAEILGIDPTLPIEQLLPTLEAETTAQWLEWREQHPGEPVVIGIAGPGASGKGTLGGYLKNDLGYAKVVNTTTRTPRHYEENGRDYYFVDDATFDQRQQHGDFLVSMERPGRGKYGVEQPEIERRIAESKGIGAVVEENPRNLLTALGSLAKNDSEEAAPVILYILPPHPIAEVSARRLYGRSAADEQDRTLTAQDVDSTLGDRQIDEFEDLNGIAGQPDIHLVLLTNDQLADSQAKLDKLFGPTSNE
jgi:guanylate kinase